MMGPAPENKAFIGSPKNKALGDWGVIVNNIYGGDVDLAISRHQSCADSALNKKDSARYALCVK